jgi:hypothetical protein
VSSFKTISASVNGTALRAQCHAKFVDTTASAHEGDGVRQRARWQELYRRTAQEIFSIAIALPQ